MKKIVIIGGGPAGYEAALHGASAGAEIVLIEHSNIGGTCLNHGCIPTKTLIENASFYSRLRESERFGISFNDITLDYSKVVARKAEVITNLQSGILSRLKKAGVILHNGYGEVKDSKTVLVHINNGDSEEITCDVIIIATGSKPMVPSFVKDNNSNLMTSKELLDCSKLPDSIVIVGGGVIGVEFASLLNDFGVEVTVLEYAPRILPTLDSAIGKRLKAVMSKSGIQIEINAKVTSISENQVTYETKKGSVTLEPESILLSVGRIGNYDKDMCDRISIEHNERFIDVDSHYMTSVEDVYAIGDVNGRSLLAHAAYDQGIQLMDYLIKGVPITEKVIPGCVFSTPEAAAVGLSEEDAKEQGITYETKKTLYSTSGKAMAMDETVGFVKSIIDENGRVLGLHILGAHASDMIHYGSIAIDNRISVVDLQSTIFAHPTLGELFSDNVKLYTH